MKICSLVEFTAHFFYAGDTSSALELESMLWNGDYADVTKDIPKDVLDDDLADDVVFEEDACAITYSLIHEGRCDYGYSTGVEYEEREMGTDWIRGAVEELIKEATLKRDEYAELAKNPLAAPRQTELPIRSFRWIEALGYWSSYDAYTGEHDGGVEFYGEVQLADIAGMLLKNKPSIPG